MTLSFEKKLLLSVACLLLTSLILLSVVSGSLLQREVQQSVRSEMHHSLQQVWSMSNNWLQSRSDILRAFSQQMTDQPGDHWQDPLTLVRRAGHFDLVYVGTEDGQMLMSQPEANLPSDFDPRTRPWYMQAVEDNDLVVTPPYQDAGSGNLIMSIGLPMQSNTRDVLASDLTLTAIIEQLLSAETRWTSQLWILDEEQRVLVHEDPALVQQLFQEVMPGKALPAEGELVELDFQGQSWLASTITLPQAGWTFLLLMDSSEAYAGLVSLAWQVGMLSLLVLLFCVILLYFLINYLTRPLKNLAYALQEISTGEADLTQRLQISSADEFGRMSQAFNQFVARLQQLLQQVQQLGQSLEKEAEATQSQVAENLEQLGNQQAEVSQMASAVDQMSAATSEIANNAEQTAERARSAVDSTREGTKLVETNREGIAQLAEQLDDGMQALNEVDVQVQDITGILATIQGVAEQTNLLALNAAIEAARAGDHGRGFAVVADEVRSLSQRTHEATDEIRQMIETLQLATGQAVKIMKVCHQQTELSVEGSRQAAEHLQLIDEVNGGIRDMAIQIASAVEEQNTVTSEMSGNAESIREVSDQLTGQSEVSRERAESLRIVVDSLQKLMRSFRV